MSSQRLLSGFKLLFHNAVCYLISTEYPWCLELHSLPVLTNLGSGAGASGQSAEALGKKCKYCLQYNRHAHSSQKEVQEVT